MAEEQKKRTVLPGKQMTFYYEKNGSPKCSIHRSELPTVTEAWDEFCLSKDLVSGCVLIETFKGKTQFMPEELRKASMEDLKARIAQLESEKKAELEPA